jgi:tetratricopeptide (TPR) repeat protein
MFDKLGQQLKDKAKGMVDDSLAKVSGAVGGAIGGIAGAASTLRNTGNPASDEAPVPAGTADLSFQAARHIREGDEYLEDGEYEDAVEAYTKAQELEPDNQEYRGKLCRALVKQGDGDLENNEYEDAVKAYTKALELEPGNQEYRGRICHAWVEQGDGYLEDDENEDAEECYTKALDVDPNCEEAREGLRKLGREVPASVVASAPPPPAAGARQKTFCAGCGTELAPGVKFCPSCGAAAPATQPQKAFCANCGTEITGAKFCPSCGMPAGGLVAARQNDEPAG